jgi:hypothetical protein
LLTSVDQDEGHLQIDAVLGNLAILHDDLLFLDPGALDVFECLDCASDALLDGILEALVELEIISVTLAIDTCRLLRENKLFQLPRTCTPAKLKTVQICSHQEGCGSYPTCRRAVRAYSYLHLLHHHLRVPQLNSCDN